MNLKKVLLALTAMIVFGVFVAIQGTAYATTLSSGQEVYMGITKLMTNSNPNMGYGINTPKQDKGAYIWNVLKYDSPTSYTTDNIYCIKAEVGFTTSAENGTFDHKPYNVFYNMKTERQAIKSHAGKNGEVLKSLVESNDIEGTTAGTTINRYNAILAVLDRLYLPGESTDNEKKELIFTLLKAANEDANYEEYNTQLEMMAQAFSIPEGTYLSDFLEENSPTKYNLTDYALTDDDINAVQQAVLWYFTNHEQDKYDHTSKTATDWLTYTLDGNTYKTLSSYQLDFTEGGEQNGPGLARRYQAELLYKYMIRQAKENAGNYEESKVSSGLPVRVDTTTLEGELSGNNYRIGPIHMTQLNSNPYKVDLKVKNNGTDVSSTDYQLVDGTGATVGNLVGNDFYISIPKNKVNSLTVDIVVNYNDTTMTLWTSSDNVNVEQPLVEVHKTKQSKPIQLKYEPVIEVPEEPKIFDLKLIKRITEVNNQKVPERKQSVDVSKLNTEKADSTTTAEYKMNKEPVGVTKGDIVTYTFRIYNEGTIDGYAQKITEDVPEGLQFLWSKETGAQLKADTTLTDEEKEAIEFNQKYLWGDFVYDSKKENIIQISTDYLSKQNETTVNGNLIKAFGENDGTKTEKDLHYKEVYVKFKVISEKPAGTVIRNEAAITEDWNKEGKTDRDSHTDQWNKQNDNKYYDDNKKWPIYKEDDEDYDNIILQSFDLALRKFIIAISGDTKIEKNEELKNEDGSYTRAPVVDTSKLNTKDEKGKLITTATYNHTKEPIIVKPNDIVVYMLRVYNEGEMDGYASEIKDHLPPYLEYVDSEFNKQYGWQVSEDGRTATTKYLSADKFIINKAKTNENGKIELSYKEVPIMCKVKENAKTNENITNIADISEYLDKTKNPIADRDSQANNVKLPEDSGYPSYEKWQQDEDDFERVIVKIFDLALRKWVTQAIVIENGQQTVTQTGHDAWDDPEAVVKVELHRKKLNQVAVKFRYSIRVYNQGEIEGYAKEVTDYIPAGLKFVAEDNPGWTDEGNNVISTKLLENTLLKPGEYADLEVLLTWINGENNMGVMNNIAEISEDYNKYGVPDIDSTPDNQKQGEDDIDDAPVLLSISTGQMRIYFTLGFIVLTTIAGGVVLIKKFVI